MQEANPLFGPRLALEPKNQNNSISGYPLEQLAAFHPAVPYEQEEFWFLPKEFKNELYHAPAIGSVLSIKYNDIKPLHDEVVPPQIKLPESGIVKAVVENTSNFQASYDLKNCFLLVQARSTVFLRIQTSNGPIRLGARAEDIGLEPAPLRCKVLPITEDALKSPLKPGELLFGIPNCDGLFMKLDLKVSEDLCKDISKKSSNAGLLRAKDDNPYAILLEDISECLAKGIKTYSVKTNSNFRFNYRVEQDGKSIVAVKPDGNIIGWIGNNSKSRFAIEAKYFDLQKLSWQKQLPCPEKLRDSQSLYLQ